MSVYFVCAQIIGLIGLIVLMMSFQKNSKEVLLKYQIISSLLFSIQYIFLNAYTGSLMNLICMIRNYIFKKYNDKIPVFWLILIISAMVGLSMMTYNGFISILPMVAVVLYSISLWIGNLKKVRIVELISCSLFIIYNIKVLAISGLIATVIELLAALVAIFRFDITKKVDN